MATKKKAEKQSQDGVPSVVWTWGTKPSAKLLFVYLDQGPDRNVVGLSPFEPEVIAARTGMVLQQITTAADECVKGEAIALDAERKYVLVLDRWARAQKTAAQRVAAIEILADATTPLVEVFLALYPDMQRAVEAQRRISRGSHEEFVSNIPAEFPLFMLDSKLEEQWNVRLQQWAGMFPTVNLPASLQAAHDWLNRNRGTKRGKKTDVGSFLQKWIGKDAREGAHRAEQQQRASAGRNKRDDARQRFGDGWQ